MKKILIAQALRPFLDGEKSFRHRSNVTVFSAKTNDEILALHRAERVNLIITQLDMPGISTEQLCTEIRNDKDLYKVSLMMTCSERDADKVRMSQCNPNAVLMDPVDKAVFLAKAKELLDIPWRESYRVLLSVNVDGNSRDRAFFCRSENISATGLLLETERSLKEGDRLTCSFFLPGSKQITASATVVRAMKEEKGAGSVHYGVKFDALPSESRTAIESFVKSKAQMAQPARD